MAGHYCVNCGTPLEVRVIEGRELQACATCDFVLWRDPKVVTMALIEAPGGLVLARRGIEPGYGAWCLPGGFVNDDEHPAEAAARECLEEVLAEVEITGLLDVFHIRKSNAPSMVSVAYCAVLRPGARPAPGHETIEVGVFDPEHLPELAFPSHRRAVLEWRRIRETSGSRAPR